MPLNWNLSDDHLDQSTLDSKFDFHSTDIDLKNGGSEGEMPDWMPNEVEDADIDDYPPLPMPGLASRRVRRTYEEDIEIYPGRRSIWKVPRPNLFEKATDREFYIMYFPIDIYPSKGKKKYNRIEFGVQIDEEADVDVLDLCPQDVYGLEEVKRIYRLAPTLKFREVDMSVGSAEWEMSYQRLRPMITIFGLGKPKFGWVYSTGTDDRIHPGSQHNWVLINAPAGLETVSGTFYSDVVYEEKTWKYWWKKDADAEREFTIELDSSDVLSERWWEEIDGE